MSILTATGITFGDSTSQTTASSYIGGRGQVFTSSGTFTVPAGVTAVKVTVVGCGGGGGGSYFSGGCNNNGGGTGGAGGSGSVFVTGLTPAGTVSVTIGAGGTGGTGNASGTTGGTTSFGAYASATGGSGGFAYGQPGTNGRSSGSLPEYPTNIFSISGVSVYGNATNINGNAPTYGYGGGGSGSYNIGAGGSNTGGAGKAGLCMVEW